MLNDLENRYLGCLAGLAIGDAMGAPIEFAPPGSFTPIVDLIAGGPFNLQRGQYTDDTIMAMCLAESIIEKRGFDPVDQLDRYLRWYRHGYHSSKGYCFDIGNTTRASLEDFEYSRQPYRPYGGMRGGNGAIMRLAPVAMAFASDPELAIHLCGESAKTTHHFMECVDTCRLLGALLVGALQGEPRETLLQPGYTPVNGLWDRKPLVESVQAISVGSYKMKEPPQIRGGGLSVESLEAALWAFSRSTSYEDGLLLAVNLGDDADSTGAVYGQLAGAFHSLGAIPPEWLEALWNRALILDYSRQLYGLAAQPRQA